MTPRIFVACLPCREAGVIVGAWFDALTAPHSVSDFNNALRRVVTDVPPDHLTRQHQTLRVIDHTGFGRRLSSETTVEHARDLAREIGEGQ